MACRELILSCLEFWLCHELWHCSSPLFEVPPDFFSRFYFSSG